MTRQYLVAVSPVALRAELAKRGLNSNLIASLSGLSGRKALNDQLAKGGISQPVADVLDKLNIPY